MVSLITITIRFLIIWGQVFYSGPPFTKRTDVLPQDRVTSRGRDIRVYTFPIAVKFDRHLGSSAAEMPIKFQSDTIITTSNLAALSFHEIWLIWNTTIHLCLQVQNGSAPAAEVVTTPENGRALNALYAVTIINQTCMFIYLGMMPVSWPESTH